MQIWFQRQDMENTDQNPRKTKHMHLKTFLMPSVGAQPAAQPDGEFGVQPPAHLEVDYSVQPAVKPKGGVQPVACLEGDGRVQPTAVQNVVHLGEFGGDRSAVHEFVQPTEHDAFQSAEKEVVQPAEQEFVQPQ